MMRAYTISNTLLYDVTPPMYYVRGASLPVVLISLSRVVSYPVTALGSDIESKTTEKHQIKHSMRLCSDPHFHSGLVLSIYSCFNDFLSNKS